MCCADVLFDDFACNCATSQRNSTEAATRVTSSTFDILKADPKFGRAEALRRAMLAYMSDPSRPQNAYPAYWAPFSLIGEGAAR